MCTSNVYNDPGSHCFNNIILYEGVEMTVNTATKLAALYLCNGNFTVMYSVTLYFHRFKVVNSGGIDGASQPQKQMVM